MKTDFIELLKEGRNPKPKEEPREKGKAGRPKGGSLTPEDDKDPAEGEFNKNVAGFVVFTDVKNNKYVLGKDKKSFISIVNEPIQDIKHKIYLIDLGNKDENIKKEKKKIWTALPDEIAGKNKFEDDIEVLDQFQMADYM